MKLENNDQTSTATELSERQDAVPLQRTAPLILLSDTPKGRGVFATRAIPAGTIIEVSPVLVLPPEENIAHVEKTVLYHYTYTWPLPSPSSTPSSSDTSPCPSHPASAPAPQPSASPRPAKTQAIVLGLGSMFNHSLPSQNVGYTRDLSRHLIYYKTLRNVREGEELCISYGAPEALTFVDAEAEVLKREAEEEEGEEGGLGRIEVDLA